MKRKLAQFIVWYGGGDDLLQDAHVYGGGMLVAAGFACLWRPAFLIAFGLLLLYIGLRRS